MVKIVNERIFGKKKDKVSLYPQGKPNPNRNILDLKSSVDNLFNEVYRLSNMIFKNRNSIDNKLQNNLINKINKLIKEVQSLQKEI